jgi:signal peptidase I
VRGWLFVERPQSPAGTPRTPGYTEVGSQPPVGEVTTPPVQPPVETPVEAGAADESARKRARSNRKKQGYEWLVLVAASLAVALIVRGFLIQAFYIPSESMVPTLVKNDRVLVNKLSYKLHDVHRGDIVVFKAPEGAATAQVKDLIKRVVGLPGETIEGRNGTIFIDNKPLDEPYLPPDVRSRDFPPEKIPPKKMYVLGDNRQDSRDSTFFHAVEENKIVGRAFVKIWPLNDLGLL